MRRRLEQLQQQSSDGGFILDVRSPVEERVEMRQGKRRKVSKCFLPGYIFVELELDDSDWQRQCTLLRSVPSIVGFVGCTAKEKPRAVPTEEIRAVLERGGELSAEKRYIVREDFAVGEVLKVIEGPFEGFSGTVDEVHPGKERMRVMVVIFGRPTPVELEVSQVEKIV